MILKWSELDLRSICIDRGPAMTLWAVQLENVAREEACQSRLFGLDHGHSHSTQTVFHYKFSIVCLENLSPFW